MYYENPAQIEVRRKYEGLALEKELYELGQIAPGSRPFAIGKAWVSATASLSRKVERGSQALRALLTGPSEPSEQCC